MCWCSLARPLPPGFLEIYAALHHEKRKERQEKPDHIFFTFLQAVLNHIWILRHLHIRGRSIYHVTWRIAPTRYKPHTHMQPSPSGMPLAGVLIQLPPPPPPHCGGYPERKDDVFQLKDGWSPRIIRLFSIILPPLVSLSLGVLAS